MIHCTISALPLSMLGVVVLVSHKFPNELTPEPHPSSDAAVVLALRQKIEATVVAGDVAFAETVLSRDFHFRHGDGWTRG